MLTRRDFIKTGVAGAAGLAAAPYLTAASNRPGSPPNLVFIFADQWRRPALGVYGEDPVQTPVLDQLSKEGTRFDRAYASSPICGPNRGCILSGQYITTSGTTGNDALLAPESNSFGNILDQQGYTSAYLGKWHLDGYHKHNSPVPKLRRHGFDLFYQPYRHHHFELEYQENDEEIHLGMGWGPDQETTRALEFLDKRDKSKPFAVFLSYEPPHPGWGPGFDLKDEEGNKIFGASMESPEKYMNLYEPGTQLKRRTNERKVWRKHDPADAKPGYFGSCTSIDHCVGRVLDYLKKEGLEENTIVVFTSDHGEMLGSQGRMAKGIWFEESAGVPFLLRYPGVVKAQESKALLNSIDYMPTVLGLMGIPIPPEIQGSSLAAHARGEEQKLPQSAFFQFNKGLETEKDRYWRAIINERYTFVRAQKERYGGITGPEGEVMFDNEADPYQMKPIHFGEGHDKTMKALQDELVAFIESEENDDFIEKGYM